MNVTDRFDKYSIRHSDAGPILYRRDEHGEYLRIGLLEPCGWGPNAMATHQSKLRHSKLRHLCGVIRVVSKTSRHFIDYTGDGTEATIYHLA